MTELPKKKKRTNSILDFFGSVQPEETDRKKGKKAEKIETVDMAKEPEKTSEEIRNLTAAAAEKRRAQQSLDCTDSIKAVTGRSSRSDTSPYFQDGENASTSGAEGSLKLDSTFQYNMSPPLFTDSEPTNESQNSIESTSSYEDIPTAKPRQRKELSSAWKGLHFQELNRSPECSDRLPVLQSTGSRSVLFKTPYTYSDRTPPIPHQVYQDAWNANHVRMPCSHLNEYPVHVKNGKTQLKSRWELIQGVLSGIPGPFELEEAILTYNSQYEDKWDFAAMHYFFTETLEKEERYYFFESTLEKMIDLALQLPKLCTLPIPLLKKGKQKSITLSQQQIACLLANAFFCTFPRRNARKRSSEYSNYPTINFNTIFHGEPHIVKLEKMKCIIHYFKRVTNSMPTGTVTYTRQVIDRMPEWEESETKLRRLHVSSEGTIEDDGRGMLQVDFANKYIGGGVMGMGCVQEEIRFLINPEMLVSRLFTEVLERDECLIMMGCERYSNYDGYASTFSWSGNYDDQTKRDRWGRMCTEVVAIDALVFRDYGKQFRESMVRRELDKAYCGFCTSSKSSEKISAVCTGNWGCGAFGGDKRLKALIQLMAAAQAKRDVCYLTFDDDILRDDLYNMHAYLTRTNNLSIGNILSLIEQYRVNKVLKSDWKPKMTLFQYIVAVFDGHLDSTDEEDTESQEMQHWEADEIEQQSMAEACAAVDSDDMGDSFTGKDLPTLKENLSEEYKANTP